MYMGCIIFLLSCMADSKYGTNVLLTRIYTAKQLHTIIIR